MTRDQRQSWAWVCIIGGVLILIGITHESGMQHEQSVQFDRSINRWIEHENRWKPGTMDEEYRPGTTWSHGSGPSTGVLFGGFLGIGLIIAGVAMLLSANQERGSHVASLPTSSPTRHISSKSTTKGEACCLDCGSAHASNTKLDNYVRCSVCGTIFHPVSRLRKPPPRPRKVEENPSIDESHSGLPIAVVGVATNVPHSGQRQKPDSQSQVEPAGADRSPLALPATKDDRRSDPKRTARESSVLGTAVVIGLSTLAVSGIILSAMAFVGVIANPGDIGPPSHEQQSYVASVNETNPRPEKQADGNSKSYDAGTSANKPSRYQENRPVAAPSAPPQLTQPEPPGCWTLGSTKATVAEVEGMPNSRWKSQDTETWNYYLGSKYGTDWVTFDRRSGRVIEWTNFSGVLHCKMLLNGEAVLADIAAISELGVGSTKQDVVRTYGTPKKVEREVVQSRRVEIWTYDTFDTVTFDASDRVVSLRN